MAELIVAKASDGQRYPMPLSKCWFELDSERGSGPEGVADIHIELFASLTVLHFSCKFKPWP